VSNRIRFWEQEYSLTALFLMLVITLFVVTPLAGSAIISSEIMLCFVAVLTISGIMAVTGRRSDAVQVSARGISLPARRPRSMT
jgi:hypothetical protein